MSALVVLLAFVAVGLARLAPLPAAAREPRRAGPAGVWGRGPQPARRVGDAPADAHRAHLLRAARDPALRAGDGRAPRRRRRTRVPAAPVRRSPPRRRSRSRPRRRGDGVAGRRARVRRLVARRVARDVGARPPARGSHRRDVARRAAAADRGAVACRLPDRARADADRGPGRAAGDEVPRPRHRQGGSGRAVSLAQEHPDRPGDRDPDHAGDAALRDACSGSWRATSRAGSTTRSSTSTPRSTRSRACC